MRFMTNVAVDDVQAMTPAPVFRAHAGFAAACRPVSGQECFGSAAASVVESVSGAVVAGAAGLLGLLALGEGLLARHGYANELGQERPRPVSQPVLTDERVWIDGRGVPGGISGIDSSTDSTDGSSKGDNGGKPMTPWDFRTSSPPG
jgi:hypothetical protein